MNRVCLLARLTKDPELRDAGGTPVANLRVAYNTRRKVDGEWTEIGNFVNVTVFGRQAESVAQYLSKGREVGIDGRLEIRQYEHDGQQRESAEIVADNVRFIGGNGGSDAEPTPAAGTASSSEDFPF